MGYKKITRLGSGGFGVVYQVTSDSPQGVFAVKELGEAASHSEENRLRFYREVKLQVRLKHKNVVPIIAFNFRDDPPWFMMPLAERTLSDEITQLTSDQQRTVWIFKEILHGVKHAHDNGIIHRDLKPPNILLFGHDDIRVSDFGLGMKLDRDTLSLTSTNVGMGTRSYAAPEQLMDAKHVDRRADIYSLGKILYEMLTGQFPWPNPDISKLEGPFRFIVWKCLEDDAGKRYQTIDEMLHDIEMLERTASFDRVERDPVRIARDILLDLAQQDTIGFGDIERLSRVFQEHMESYDLYTEMLPELDDNIIEAYLRFSIDVFKTILQRFDNHVSQPLPFSFCDVVAKFYENLFELIDDLNIQAMILARLLDIGHNHNRWFVQERFTVLIENIEEPALAMAAAVVIRDNPSAVLARLCTK